MEYFEAPTVVEGARPWVFLAGGITGCPDWQQDVRKELDGMEATVINPRRKEWPGDKAKVSQIEWESRYLHSSEVVSMWMCAKEPQPICMFELGGLMERFRRKDSTLKILVIGVHQDYPWQKDIETQVRLTQEMVGSIASKRLFFSNNIEGHISNIRKAAEKSRTMGADAIIGESRRT